MFSKLECKAQKGQSLFEVVIALGVMSFILVGIVSLAGASIRNSSFSNNNALATKFTQEGMEWLRQRRDESWITFTSKSAASPGTVWCLRDLSLASWPGTSGSCTATEFISGSNLFFRQATLITVSVDVIDVATTVSWSDAQGTHSVRTSTLFTNWNK